MKTRQLLGIIGSVMLIMGVFAPIISFPIVGGINYIQNSKGDGVFILILAAISLILIFANKYKGLWFTGIGSIGIMLFTFINFQLKISEFKSNMGSMLAGNQFLGLRNAATHLIQLQWGWAFLIVGAALVIASAAMQDEIQKPG